MKKKYVISAYNYRDENPVEIKNKQEILLVNWLQKYLNLTLHTNNKNVLSGGKVVAYVVERECYPCVGGPLNGQLHSSCSIDRNTYVPYNSSSRQRGLTRNKYASMIWVYAPDVRNK